MAQLHQFLNRESVLTIASSDACGPWSSRISPGALCGGYRGRTLRSLFSPHPTAAISKVFPAMAVRQFLSTRTIPGTGNLSVVYRSTAPLKKSRIRTGWPIATLPVFPGRSGQLIDSPATEQERLIGSAFAKSNFYKVSPSFVRFTNNGDNFAGRTEWQL